MIAGLVGFAATFLTGLLFLGPQTKKLNALGAEHWVEHPLRAKRSARRAQVIERADALPRGVASRRDTPLASLDPFAALRASLSDSARRFIESGEQAAVMRSTHPGLDWSGPVISYCKAFELETLNRVIRPLCRELQQEGVSEADLGDADIGRVAAFWAAGGHVRRNSVQSAISFRPLPTAGERR